MQYFYQCNHYIRQKKLTKIKGKIKSNFKISRNATNGWFYSQLEIGNFDFKLIPTNYKKYKYYKWNTKLLKD